MSERRRRSTATITHALVVDAALKAFSERGYRSTSLSVVAESLGVTRQALYHHVTSKDDILAELFDTMMTRLEDSLLSAQRAAEAEPVFIDLVHAHAVTTMANWRLVVLLVHERPQLARLPSAPVQRARRRCYVAAFTAAHRAGIASGALREAESRVVVNAVLSSITAIATWLRGPDEHNAPASIADELVELLSTGCLVTPQPDV